MPDRLQLVFNEGGVIELLLKLEEGIRSLRIDPQDAPWEPQALATPDVQFALVNWMIDTHAEGWIGARELAGVLADRGVDVAALARRNPAP